MSDKQKTAIQATIVSGVKNAVLAAFLLDALSATLVSLYIWF